MINQITLLIDILRRGTHSRARAGRIEHLLVMPIVPREIMLAMQFVVHWWIRSPVNGSLLLFVLGAAMYALVVAALGIMLGTLATTMGQFGLLAMAVLMATQLLSGAAHRWRACRSGCTTSCRRSARRRILSPSPR
jgi:ABC-2 type transport system permease protein